MHKPSPDHGTHGDSFSIDTSDIEQQLIGFTAEEREAIMELVRMFGNDDVL